MPNRKQSSNVSAPQAQSSTFVPSASLLQVSAGIALIVFSVFLIYLPSNNGGFIWDDFQLLAENPLVKSPGGLYWMWCTTEAVDYWPVTNTTFWLEWRLWGMNSTGYHITNLILHIVEALLLWVVLRKLSIPGAFPAAMIFAVHPINVETVAWIAQRKNLMAMLFFLLSILWYLKHLCSRHTPCAVSAHSECGLPNSYNPAHGVCGLRKDYWYWASLAAFAFAMLSKGSVVILPVLLLGIVLRLRPLERWDFVKTAPFFIVALALGAVNVWFQTHGGEPIRTVSYAERLLGAGGVVWFYLYKSLLPVDLVFVYPQWQIETGNLLWWLPLLAALAVTAALWLYRASWSRPLLFAWGFFCISLVPVMGLTDVYFMKFSMVADHYQHIALVGVVALAAAGINLWHNQSKETARRAAAIVAIVAVGTLALLTCRQSGLYRDEFTLYQATLEKNPGCWMVHSNLSVLLEQSGRIEEAIEHCKQALRLKPDYPEALYNMGNFLKARGQFQQAIEHYEKALRLKRNYPDAHNNLGATLTQTGRFQEAIEHFNRVLELRPNDADAENNLGLVLYKSKRYDEALEHYRQALLIKPDYPDVYNNISAVMMQLNRQQEAVENLEQALRLKSDYYEAQCNLGNIYKANGQYQKAIEYYERTLRLKPDYLEARYNLANVLARAGRLEEAIEHYRQTLRLKPDYAEAHNNLGSALVQTGRLEEAIEHYQQALQLKPDYINACNNMALTYAKLHKSSEAVDAAQRALELARSQGQSSQAQKIEEWLNSYRAGLLK